MIVFTIALFVFQSESFAQQGTLTDNATFPTSVSALTVQGSSAPEGSAVSFIKFKLTPNLPPATPGGFVAKATLTLYVGGLNTSGSFNVYRVTSPWGEGDTTAPTYDAANPVIIGVPVPTANSYITVDLTALAQQWLGTDGLGTGGVPNYGIALVANTTTTAFSFDSKESTTTSHPARLAVLLNHAATADISTNADIAKSLNRGAQDADIVSPADGQVYYNTTSNVFKVFDGATSTWKIVDAGNAATLSSSATISGNQVNGELTNATIAGNGVTGNIAASQINGNITNATIAGYVTKVGDTMTGTLNLPANGLKVGTDQLVLSAGNVGIGTVSPTSTLDIGTSGTNEPILSLSSLDASKRWNVATNSSTFYGVRDDLLFFGWNAGITGAHNRVPGQHAFYLGMEASFMPSLGGNLNTETYFEYAAADGVTFRRNLQMNVDTVTHATSNTMWGSLVMNSSTGTLLARMDATGAWTTYAQNHWWSGTNGLIGTVTNHQFSLQANNSTFLTLLPAASGIRLYQPNFLAYAGTKFNLGTGNAQTLALQTGGTDKVTILNSGKVGIGTNSPAERLEVAGNLKVSGAGNGFKFPDGTTQTTAATFSSSTTISGNQVNGELTNATIAGNRVTGEVANATNATTALTANALSSGATVPGAQVSGNIPGNASSITGTITGNQVSSAVAEATHATNADNATTAGNASAVTNGVYTVGDQTVEGNKTFTSPIVGSLTGNAATATNATNATNADVAKSLNRAAQDADIVSPADGQIYYNTTSNVFKVFDGPTSTWKIVDAGTAATLSSSAMISGNQVSGELTNASIAGSAVTGNIAASQISGNITNATIAGYVTKVGDTMTGTLNLPNNGLVVGSTQMVLSGGNVGIGTISPQDRLHVNGSIRVDTLGVAGSTQLCSNASNQIATCSSSLRYKTQIAPFSAGLEIINRLRPISFTWRDHPERDFGLGAEDVAAIEPLLVTRNAQGQIEGVKYDRVSIVLVNAIKQQQEQIKQQQSEIEGLKKLVCQDHPEATLCRR